MLIAISMRRMSMSRVTNLEEVGSIWEDEDPTVHLVERSRRGEAPRVDQPTIVPPWDRTVNIIHVNN